MNDKISKFSSLSRIGYELENKYELSISNNCLDVNLSNDYITILNGISFIDSLNPLIRSNILIKSAGIYHKKVEKKVVDSYSVEDIDELHQIYLSALDLRENFQIKRNNFENFEDFSFYKENFSKINNSLELYLDFFNPERLEFDSSGKVDIKFLKNSEYGLLIIENKPLRSILFP